MGRGRIAQNRASSPRFERHFSIPPIFPVRSLFRFTPIRSFVRSTCRCFFFCFFFFLLSLSLFSPFVFFNNVSPESKTLFNPDTARGAAGDRLSLSRARYFDSRGQRTPPAVGFYRIAKRERQRERERAAALKGTRRGRATFPMDDGYLYVHPAVSTARRAAQSGRESRREKLSEKRQKRDTSGAD